MQLASVVLKRGNLYLKNIFFSKFVCFKRSVCADYCRGHELREGGRHSSPDNRPSSKIYTRLMVEVTGVPRLHGGGGGHTRRGGAGQKGRKSNNKWAGQWDFVQDYTAGHRRSKEISEVNGHTDVVTLSAVLLTSFLLESRPLAAFRSLRRFSTAFFIVFSSPG